MSDLYFGGMPTEPDVKRLMEKFKKLKPGDTIDYEDVAETIGVEPKSSRFKSVTNAWRNTLTREHNLVLECSRGTCFVVQNARQIIDGTQSDMKSAKRRFYRRRLKLKTIHDESEETMKERIHAARVCTILEHELSKKPKEIKIPVHDSLPMPKWDD